MLTEQRKVSRDVVHMLCAVYVLSNTGGWRVQPRVTNKDDCYNISHLTFHTMTTVISHIYTININPSACLLANRNIFISLSLTFNILSGISFLTEKVSGKDFCQ